MKQTQLLTDWHVAIFASGTGSNAVKIVEYLQARYACRCSIWSNRSDAPVLEKAVQMGLSARAFSREEFRRPDGVLEALRQEQVSLVVLAGFLWLVPPFMVDAFPQRIVNIHPSLLPKYGGKGMFGMHVHEAVKAAGDLESGITIHYVNEAYDEGQVILQARTPLSPADSPADIARKVLRLEHEHFPQVVERLLLAQLPV